MTDINQLKISNVIEWVLKHPFLGSSKLPIGLEIALVCLLSILVLIFLIKLFGLLLSLKSQLSSSYDLLLLTPPKEIEKLPESTKELFKLLHSLGKNQPLLNRILNVFSCYSLEIVSTKEKGIYFLLRCPQRDTGTIKRSLVAYSPDILISETNDYLNDLASSKVTELKLSGHKFLPLESQANLKASDPIAYLTGMMTKLSENELIALQFVITPFQENKEFFELKQKLNSNINVVELLKHSRFNLVKFLPKVLYSIISIPFWIIENLATNGNSSFPNVFNEGTRKIDSLSPNNEVQARIQSKVTQPLFTTNIRVLVKSDRTLTLSERTRGLLSSFNGFTYASYQSVKPVRVLKFEFVKQILLKLFSKRIVGVFNSSILSVSEVSDLFHFPFTRSAKTENLVKLHYKELPAPISLKGQKKLDIVFAKNTFNQSETPIGLTTDERRRHMYIIGATGTGKSTILLSMLKQDIMNGKGVCLIDPHGDLSEQVLSLIPENRVKDVIYFNPDDTEYPIGINLLEQTPGLTPAESIREKEFIAESIISVFHKIYSDKYSGPRMEYILRNTIHTAFTVPDATLFTVQKLLINTNYRKSVTNNLTDENLKEFWKYEFNKAGDYQKVKMISPITNKIGRFLFSSTAKQILEQPKSTINFDAILNDGKILICNLSKGKIGEDNSSIFGVLLMAKIQLASLKRARIKESERKDFYLYVDEFQNFATSAFAQILSEARKYRLNAILAHQTTSQLEDSSLVNVTLANTGTVICFRTANPEDERVVLPQFRPYVEQGEIVNLPSYHFYMKLGAMNPEEPFSGVTIPITVSNGSNTNMVIESSRKNYAKTLKPKEVGSETKTNKSTVYKPKNL